MQAATNSSNISSLSQKVDRLAGRVSHWNKGYLIFFALTVVMSAATVIASFVIFWTNNQLWKAQNELTSAKDAQLAGELKEKDLQIAQTNERAAKLEKDAADARLELAKIDPVNLPIRSIRADIFLIVRGEFFDWHFDTGPVLKGGARSVNVSLVGKAGALVELQCNEFESFPADTGNKGKIDGRTFSMSLAWPTSDWFGAQDVFKYWIDRNNASTAMLDKELMGVLISLPPTKENPEKPAEILQPKCVVTINGSIRRNFSVPKSSVTYNIFCPIKKD
jgi:hypothetical protein